MSMAKNLDERDFTLMEVLQWLQENNPELSPKYGPEAYPICLTSTKPIEELKFPNGWYYTEGVITNMDNSTTGIYHKVNVVYQP